MEPSGAYQVGACKPFFKRSHDTDMVTFCDIIDIIIHYSITISIHFSILLSGSLCTSPSAAHRSPILGIAADSKHHQTPAPDTGCDQRCLDDSSVWGPCAAAPSTHKEAPFGHDMAPPKESHRMTATANPSNIFKCWPIMTYLFTPMNDSISFRCATGDPSAWQKMWPATKDHEVRYVFPVPAPAFGRRKPKIHRTPESQAAFAYGVLD